jgi:hypothetical protein
MLKRREEAFAQAVARGATASGAAREAGYKAGSAGWRLMKRPEVKARVAALGAAMTEHAARELTRVVVPTREFVLRELIEVIHDSKAARDRGSTLRGLELVGKEIGMFVQRNMQVDSPLQRLPAERLLALLRLIEGVEAPQLTLDATVEPTDETW